MSSAPGDSASLGSSGVRVSRLGLGTAPLGGMFTRVADSDAQGVVRRALEAGLTYIDTAPQYGHGTAERRLGATLAGVPRDSYVLSSKVGRVIRERPGASTGIFRDAPPSDAVFDFTRDAVMRSLEESLARLRLDRIDVLYIHDPDDHEDEALTLAYPAVEELRSQKVVSAIGVGMNQSRIPTRFVLETDIDVVLLAGRYTLLDQSGAADLLPACVERGVSVVIGGVYNSGVLADPHGDAKYDYAAAPAEVVARARALEAVCRRHDVALKEAAIQFPLHHPAVASVLTGSRSRAELDDNLAAMVAPLPRALWEELVAEGLLAPRPSP